MSKYNWIRGLPHFKGKFRLVRLLCGPLLRKAKDITIPGKLNLHYLLPNLQEIIGFEIFADGIYEKETSDLIISRLPENGVLIDIGANIGSIALPVCRQRKDVHVVCIEGSPRVFGYLEKNVSLNGVKNCLLFNNIISDKSGDLINFYSPDELFGKGSMAPVFTDQAEQVNSVTLDGIVELASLQRVDFIKIDIEGFEYFAFKGGKKLLSSPGAPDILFEFLDWAESKSAGVAPGAAQQILLESGYTLYKIDKKGRLEKLSGVLRSGSEMLFASKSAQC